MKRYIAKTNVSINIVLSSGANRHIAFSALTGGGSTFYTDDPDIIQAMERHYKFGKLFRVDPKYIVEKKRATPAPKPKNLEESSLRSGHGASTEASPKDKPADAVKEPEDAEQTAAVAVVETAASRTEQSEEAEVGEEAEEEYEQVSEEAELKVIVVSDPDSAKAYLAEHFGYSRTKIKTLKAIKEAATAHGIVFEGI